jgi:hypothetical protein
MCPKRAKTAARAPFMKNKRANDKGMEWKRNGVCTAMSSSRSVTAVMRMNVSAGGDGHRNNVSHDQGVRGCEFRAGVRYI